MSLKELKKALINNNIKFLKNNNEINISHGAFTTLVIKKENDIFIGKIIIFINDKGEYIKFKNIDEIIKFLKN